MGAIIFTVQETAKADATKTFTVPDADIDRLVAAYQSDANVSINGTATRAQVLLYVAQTWMKSSQDYIKSKETAAQQAALTPIVQISAS